MTEEFVRVCVLQKHILIDVCVGKCVSLCSAQAYFDRGMCSQICVVALYTNIFWSKFLFTRVRLWVLCKHILIEVCFHKSLYSMQTYFFIEVSVHKCLRFIPTTTTNHGSMYLQVFTFYINIFFVEICVHKCTSLAFHEEMWLGKTRGQKYNSVFKCIEFYILICVSNLK